MKKLMIAAAAAAMIGGAGAAPAITSSDYAYNFTASLKTTAGVKGKTVTVNLGINDADEFWYRDTNVIDYSNAPTGKVTLAGTDYNLVFWNQQGDTKGYFISDVLDKLSNSEKMDLLSQFIDYADPKIGGNGQKSGGEWCAKFTYNLCYRKAASKKLSYLMEATDCCASSDDTGFSLTAIDGSAANITSALYHRFGSDTIAKSTKVEFVGELDKGIGTTLGSIYYFALAGQGTWSDKVAKIQGIEYPGVSSISGNIVGAINATCPNCCTDPDPATAFYCDGTLIDTTCTGGDASHTAAYGTFSIKFNKSKSFK